MVDLNSLCTFVLGGEGRGGEVWGGFKTKQKQGAKPFIHPALSILACVFVGGKGSAGWENVKNM